MFENSTSFDGCHNFPNKIFVYWKLGENTKNILKSFHCTATLIRWYVLRSIIPDHKTNHQIHQISCWQTKFSITIYAFMHLCIIISALLYLLHLVSLQLHKSLVYPSSVYILYDEYSEDVTGEYSSVKYQWCNCRTLGVIAPPSR